MLSRGSAAEAAKNPFDPGSEPVTNEAAAGSLALHQTSQVAIHGYAEVLFV